MSLVTTALFYCILAGEGGLLLPVEEMNVRLQGPSATNGALILLSNFGRSRTQLTLFDFGSGKAKALDDGRFQVRMARPVPFDKGFAVIGAINNLVFYIGKNGEFMSQRRLRDFEGWEEGFKIKQAGPGPDNGIFVTLSLRPSMELLFGQLDLENHRLIIHYNQPAHEQYSQAWVYCGNKLYFYNQETARIDLIDPVSFTPIQCLQQGFEPVKKDKIRPRRKSFRALIEAPIHGRDQVYFRWNLYRDKFGNYLPERRVATLVLGDHGLTTCDLRPYGSFGSRSLVFDWQIGEFVLLDAPHSCSGL